MTDDTPKDQVPPEQDNSVLEDGSGLPEPTEDVGSAPEAIEDL